MKRILITGANGYIGKNFINFLKNRSGYHILGVDKEISSPSSEHVILKLLDLRNLEDVQNELKKVKIDVIYNFAGTTRAKDYDTYYEGNVLPLLSILESLKENKKIRIFVIGTADQYGIVNSKTISETHETKPVNFYGLTKQIQEEIGLYYLRKHKLDIVFLRIFNVYGENQSDNFIISKFIRKALDAANSNNIVEDMDLEFFRDFIHIDDLNFILEKLISNAKSGEIYNIGSGEPIKIHEILKTVCRLTKKDISIRLNPAEYKDTDIISQVADIGKLRAIIREYPFTNFFQKLSDVYSLNSISVR